MKAVRVIISVQLLMREKNMTKPDTGCMEAMLFHTNVKILSDHDIPDIVTFLPRCYLVPDSDDPRPSFLDEYLAVTGNGGGGLDDYWELFTVIPEAWEVQSGIL